MINQKKTKIITYEDYCETQKKNKIDRVLICLLSGKNCCDKT